MFVLQLQTSLCSHWLPFPSSGLAGNNQLGFAEWIRRFPGADLCPRPECYKRQPPFSLSSVRRFPLPFLACEVPASDKGLL